MADYPPDLDDRQNLHRICTYWDNFHSCATTALADCQEGAAELWDKLKKESRSLNFRGSLFELCGAGSGAPRAAGAGGGLLGPVPVPLLVPVLVLVLSALPAALRWLEL
ncbi:neuritin isoform 1-T5 [Menidia menidia]